MEEFRTLVLYRTSHGSTKRYAEWIADAVNGVAIEASKRNFSEWSTGMKTYDMVVFGGNLNARGINGLQEFKTAVLKSMPENVAYFCVGSYPSSEETRLTHLRENFPGADEETMPFYYFRGRLDYIGLTFVEKRIMGALMKKIEKTYPEDRTPEQSEILEAYYDDVDWSDKRTIAPLVEYIKSFMSPEQWASIEPVAKERMAATEAREAKEDAEFEAEMDRREALFHQNEEKAEQDKIKRMSKKQRERYLARKAEEAMLKEEPDEELNAEEGPVDDYSDFED